VTTTFWLALAKVGSHCPSWSIVKTQSALSADSRWCRSASLASMAARLPSILSGSRTVLRSMSSYRGRRRSSW
jgi:hypothetical protein